MRMPVDAVRIRIKDKCIVRDNAMVELEDVASLKSS